MAMRTKGTAGTRAEKDEKNDAVLQALADLADASAANETVDFGIRDHDKTWIAKPDTMDPDELADIAINNAKEAKLMEDFVFPFRYRLWDVALAFNRVTKQVFGSTPTSIKGESAQVEIPVSATETVTIPWGTVAFAKLKGRVTYQTTNDPELGMVGVLIINCPKKLHLAARGLCQMVVKDLEENSIYRGKAISSDQTPRFMDPWSATDPHRIVWTRTTESYLKASLINLMRFPERTRERGVPVHRTVLFEGDAGNGKTETTNIIAQIAVECGITAIFVTTSLDHALKQAQMSSPAVILLEDIERLIREANAQELSKFLKELDGAEEKGYEIMLVATTNFLEEVQKIPTVNRRMAKIIPFGPFDSEAAARYLEIVLEGQAQDDVDFPAIAAGMDGWGNSYIAKVVEFAKGLNLENEDPRLSHQSLMDAVAAYQQEWAAFAAANAVPPAAPKLDSAFQETAIAAVTSGQVAMQENEDGNYVLVRADK